MHKWYPAVCQFVSRLVLLLVLCVGAIAIAATASMQVFAQQSGSGGNFERCRTIPDDAARVRCYEGTTTKPAMNPIAPTLGPGAGSWRLVRTRNPSGGPDAVSIMQTADTAKSDLELAGLMLRCREGGFEVLVVLVTPLPPRAHPKVTVTTGGKSTDFTGTIVPPGAAVLLPQEASELASGSWTRASEISVQVEAGQGDGIPAIRGIVPLTGLKAAVPSLLANCPSQ